MHKPTKMDAAADLRRCIYASFGKEKFDDPNFKLFFHHAMKILDNLEVQRIVIQKLNSFNNENKNENQRREDLLDASIFLLN